MPKGDQAILDAFNALNYLGSDEWVDLGKYENVGNSDPDFSVDDAIVDDLAGNWSISAAAAQTYDSFVMIFKGGNDNNTSPSDYVAYLLDGTSGTWESPLIGNNGNA